MTATATLSGKFPISIPKAVRLPGVALFAQNA